jgi:hypothetical protein
VQIDSWRKDIEFVGAFLDSVVLNKYFYLRSA